MSTAGVLVRSEDQYRGKAAAAGKVAVKDLHDGGRESERERRGILYTPSGVGVQERAEREAKSLARMHNRTV